MLQKLQKALAEAKAGENIQNDSTKKLTNYIFLVSSKRNFQKSIQQYNKLDKVIKQNGYYIYELWEQ